MKTRNGFVSNSSSASFVLKVDEPLDRVVHRILEDSYILRARKDLSREAVLALIVERQLYWEEHSFMTSHLDYLKDKRDYLENTQDIPLEDLMTIYIHIQYGLDMSGTEDGTGTLFTWDVTMHNDFIESVPEFLQELIMQYVFRSPRHAFSTSPIHGILYED
jgi:hypothetical protein